MKVSFMAEIITPSNTEDHTYCIQNIVNISDKSTSQIK
jgi:hypothetical protein